MTTRIDKAGGPSAELKTDGLGNALDPDALYFVQDSRSVVGNCALWWAVDAAGYTCDLKGAGLYTGLRCSGMRGTDVPWPEKHVREHAVTHVRGDTRALDRRDYKPGPRT